MADFVAQLDGLDLAAVDDTLARVRTALEQAQQLGVEGLDPKALLGADLGAAIDAVAAVAADPDDVARLGRAALEALGGIIDLPEVGDLDAILTGITEVGALLAQVAGVLATDGATGTEILDRILTSVSGSIGLQDLLGEVTDRAVAVLGVEVPDALTAPLAALRRLASQGDVDASELAALLSTVVVGVDLDDLASVGASAEAALRIVAQAGDPLRLEAAVAAVHVRLDASYALLVPGSPVDVTALLAALDAVGAAVGAVGAEVDRFVAGLATDLRTAANAMAELDLAAAAGALLDSLPLPAEDIPRVMVASLEDLARAFEGMTAEALAAALEAVQTQLLDALGSDALTDLLSGIDEAFAELGRLIDALPVRHARDLLVDTLASAQQEVLAFDGFDFLDDLLAPVRDLEATIRDLDLSTITDAVSDAVDEVNTVFADFPVEDLRDAVEAVIEPLGAILEELTPLVRQAADELERLIAELEAVDFDAAGTATLDLLRGIREQVQEAIGGGDVPEAVKVLVAGAAAVLAELDLAVELTGPFEREIARIDVEALLAPIEEVWLKAGDTLRRAAPAALIAELDPPFDQLLAKVDELSTEPLVRALSGLFDDLLSHVEALDPRTLMDPLEREFQALLGRLRALLDPAPLFAPLREGYAALRGLVDGIDIAAAVNGALGGIVDVPDALLQSVGDRLTAGSGAVSAPVAGADEAFRFGDVLRPVAAFVGEIRSRLDELGDGVLGAALDQLAGATRGLWSVIDPAAGFTSQVADALDARLALADPRSGVGPLAEMRSAVESLTAAVARLDVDAAARVRLDAATGAIDVDARVSVDVSAAAELSTGAARVRSTAGGTELGRSTRLLARALQDLLPGELRGSGLDPSAAVDVFLDAVFAQIDLAPLVAELDAIGDRIQARLVAFADEMARGLLRLWTALFRTVEPLLPSSLIARVQAGLDSVLGRLDVLDPSVVEDEVRDVVDAAVSLLGVHSPAALARQLGAVFDAALDRVRELDPGTLLGDLDPFAGLKEQLEALRPSVVLDPLVDRTESFTAALETITAIDLDFVGEVVLKIRTAFTTVLDGVEAEWDALLDELKSMSGDASASVG